MKQPHSSLTDVMVFNVQCIVPPHWRASDQQYRGTGVASYTAVDFFFRPTPDGSRQVVYQAGKTIALCKFTEFLYTAVDGETHFILTRTYSFDGC